MTEMKMTRQRRVILEELASTTSHPTADELLERVRRRLPHVSLGTIYRNLDVLDKAGMVHRLETDGHQRRYDADLRPHWHVRCVECDRLDDVFDLPFETSIENVRSRAHYTIIGHRLEFLGICPACRQNATRRRSTTTA